MLGVLMAGAAGLIANQGTRVSAADTTFVYAGSGQAGIAIELFLPDTVIINEGDTVEFVNPYEEPHTVTFVAEGDETPFPEAPASNVEAAESFTGEQSFNSGLLEKDDHFSVTFPEGGSYTLLCLLHPGMEIDVTVVGTGIFVPPQGANSPAVMETISTGLEVGESASSQALAEVQAENADATDNWLVETGPSVPFETASVDVMRFLPQEVNIGVGDTVTWRNDYFLPHMVTFFAGPPPADFNPFVSVIPSNVFQQGELYNAVISANMVFSDQKEFSLTFPEAGTYSYICAIHANQGMAGVIQVGQRAAPAPGDGGITQQSSGAWMMIAGVALLSLSSAAGAFVAVRSKS